MTKNAPIEHIKSHATGYIVTAVTAGILGLVYLGGQTTLDGRYLVAETHDTVHQQHEVKHDTFEQLYIATESEKKLELLKKDLRQARREKRRFDAYIAADPDSKVLMARTQSAAELGDVILELEDELKIMQAKLSGGTP